MTTNPATRPFLVVVGSGIDVGKEEVSMPTKKQHFVPRVYMKAWETQVETLKEPDKKFNGIYVIKDGSIGVKGGWRIYSSGPGIYLNQLITAVLGIRQKAQSVVFDPMLPEKLSGLTLTYQLFDKPVTYKFYPNQSAKIVIDGQEVPFKFEENPYREGGMEVQKDEVLSLLNEASVIEIYH